MKRLEKIAAALNHQNLDALLITDKFNIWYALGEIRMDGFVLITKEGKGYYSTDGRYIEIAQKTVPKKGYEVIFCESRNVKPLVKKLIEENNIKTLGFLNKIMVVDEYLTYKNLLPCEMLPASALYEEIRSVKEEGEIAYMKAAQKIAEDALEELLPEIKVGMREREIAAKLDYNMAKRGSEGVSFPTILVSGINGSLPHGVPGDRKLQNGDFLTIDFGAIYHGYHSDMTRTFAIGYASEEMKTVYNTVLLAQKTAIEAFCVGISGEDLDYTARKVIEDAGYGEYFIHLLGHSLGLSVNEQPYAIKGNPKPFIKGQLVTIEPGIYIAGKFGVRIEDVLYLGEKGKENLTHFPKELCIL